MEKSAQVPAGAFEAHMLARLESDQGEQLARAYRTTKEKLCNQIYPEIRGAEPNLSDHGEHHVMDVQDKALRLLSSSDEIRDLSPVELYCLGTFILFHDTGNVYGRTDHEKKVARVFDKIRGTDASLRRERTLVVRATAAHTGKAQDGSLDTLKDLDDAQEHLLGKRVRLRELAAILRLADELCEGPHRTSEFMQKENLYSGQSRHFHEYANSTNIMIERPNGRIVINYEVRINPKKPTELRHLLSYIYHRMMKLNQERQYTRYYSKLLEPFNSTEASFSFHCGDELLQTQLSPLKLVDSVVVPGSATRDIADIDPDYALETLVPDLLTLCPDKEGNLWLKLRRSIRRLL